MSAEATRPGPQGHLGHLIARSPLADRGGRKMKLVPPVRPDRVTPVTWRQPPRQAHFSQNEVHLWKAAVDLDESWVGELVELLSHTEISRAERFRFRTDRTRFIGRRALLRTLLGHYLGKHPASLRFVTNDYGKPSLSGELEATRIRFNTSHSDGVAVLAFAANREVGVDVERVRDVPECLAVAGQYFRPEVATALRAFQGTERSRAFLARWTDAEALAKAEGIGLRAFDALSASDQTRQSRWSLKVFDDGNDRV